LRATTGILVVTILCCHPPKSSAQESIPVDPVETMPIRFGPLGLTPTLTITNFGIDSNVFNDAADPRSDFTMTTTPKMQGRLRSGRLLLAGSLATGFVYYQKFSDERSIDYATDARADADLGWFRPYASAQRLDTKDRLNNELDLRAPRVSTNVSGGARFVTSPRTALTMAARRTSVTFDEASVFDDVLLSHTLNSDATMVEGGLEMHITPLTTLSVMTSRQQDRFEQSPERDADSYRVMPTLTLEAPAFIQGTIGVGFRHFNGLAAELPDYSGIVFQGALSHTVAERTKFDLALTRDVQYSFELAEPYYLTTGIRVTVTHQLQESLDVRGAVARDRLDYRATDGTPEDDRRDRLRLFSAGVGYRFSPNLRIGLDLEHARRLSDRDDRDYDRTRLLGSATYGF
jgi:hypothetical protein